MARRTNYQRLRLVKGRRGQDNSASLRRRSTCSVLVHTVMISAPSTQSRGRPFAAKTKGVSSMSGTNKLIGEGDQGDQRADRITNDTVQHKPGSCSGFITPWDGGDDVSIHCKPSDDTEGLQQ